MRKVFNDFADATDEEIIEAFAPLTGEPVYRPDMHVLVADYTYEDYSGSAFVLFEQGGVLYENHGSHCSCYGLEDQWQPERVQVEEMRRRYTRALERERRELQEGVWTPLSFAELQSAIAVDEAVLEVLG